YPPTAGHRLSSTKSGKRIEVATSKNHIEFFYPRLISKLFLQNPPFHLDRHFAVKSGKVAQPTRRRPRLIHNLRQPSNDIINSHVGASLHKKRSCRVNQASFLILYSWTLPMRDSDN